MVKSKRFSGVYIHEHKDGNKSIYIMYRDQQGKLVKEKVGKRSEGYTEEQARNIRNTRIHQQRHPEEFPKEKEQQQGRVEVPTCDEAFQAWFDFKKGQGVKKVRDSKYVYDKHLKNLIGSKPLDAITAQFITTKINTLFLGYRGNGTIYHVHLIIRGLYKHAIEMGQYEGMNPMSKVKTPRIKGRRERWLTRQEARQLLDALKKVDEELYHQALIMLMTGMRKAFGKGGKVRHCEIPKALIPIFYKVIDNDPDRPSLWLTKGFKDHKFKKVVKSLHLDWGVDPKDTENLVVVHTLRHTYGSWLAQKGTPVMVIKELMGHSDIGMTMRYAKLGPRPGTDAVDGFESGLVD